VTIPGPAASPVGTTLSYPYVWRRYLSTLIDGLLILAAIILIPQFLDNLPQARITLFLAVLLYEPVLTAFACTLGQRVIGIRVRRAADPSRRITLPAAFLRWVVKLLLGFISFFSMRASNRFRALHDFAAGSIMINAR